MRKNIYNFTLPIPSVTLVSFADSSSVKAVGNEGCFVFLSPSDKGDYHLSVLKNGLKCPPQTIHLWCAGYYLHSVCGLPYSPLEFNTPSGVLSAEFFDTGNGLTGILMDACKQMLTKNVELPGGVSAAVSTVLYLGNLYRILHTKRVDLVCSSSLKQIRFLHGFPDCKGALAISCDGEGIGTEGFDPFVAASILEANCTVPCQESGAGTVSFCGQGFLVARHRSDRICIAPRDFHCMRVFE